MFAWRHPAIRYSLFMAVAAGMLFNLGTTLPLMTTRAFHLGAGGWAGGAAGARDAFALWGAALLVTAGLAWRSLSDRGESARLRAPDLAAVHAAGAL